jgi:16S rRNA (guanine1207-N2)-methyltransferase
MTTLGQTQLITARLGDAEVTVVTKPGFPHWNEITPASRLLAAAIGPPAPGAQVIVIGGGHGALAAALARTARRVYAHDPNIVATEMARLTAARNGATNLVVRNEISALPDLAGTLDIVAIEAPPNRQLARRWLVEGQALLRPGGRLFVAGANHDGIQPILDDTRALFGELTPLGARERSRVGMAIGAAEIVPPEWALAGGIAPGSWIAFDVDVAGAPIAIRSLPGVFAHDHLDAGTALLLAALAQLPNVRGARVLDVGCGYGVIGVAAARAGAAHVDLVDISLLAVAAAQATLAANSVTAARALASDGLAAVRGERYDLVVMNPPFHTGKAVDYELPRRLIGEARAALAPGGRIVLVTNAFIRHERLLGDLFGAVDCLAENRSYRVLAAYDALWHAS